MKNSAKIAIVLSLALCLDGCHFPGNGAAHIPTIAPDLLTVNATATADPSILETREVTEPVGPVWDESQWQESEPISPQPGDTSASWQPELAEDYPADTQCGPMELLEKWLAVEGLTMEDLEDCRQLILVSAQESDGAETITCCYEKGSDGAWQPVERLSDLQGWVGKNGIIHHRKRNTDTSPAGLWSLGLAFGNEAKPEGLNMPWRAITPNSEWVCDEESPYFNTWQERGDPTLAYTWNDDVEHLADYQTQYAYACVICYNTAPYTIPNRGCAIFLHCSTGPTGGCVGLEREDMLRVLLWLNPEENPHILITGYESGAQR